METVLVVEDEAHQRLLYEWELGDEGYRVITAADLEEASEAIARDPPDCIVLGTGRDQRTTGERLESFARNQGSIPLVINATSRELCGRMAQCPAADCLVKSSDVGQLTDHVRALLSGRATWRRANLEGGVTHGWKCRPRPGGTKSPGRSQQGA